MRTNKFNPDKYSSILLGLVVVAPFILCISVGLTLLFSKTEYRHGKEYIMEPYSTIIWTILGAMILCGTIGIIFAIAGKRLYRKYALQLIDYEDENAIEDIWVDNEKVHVAYHEDNADEITEVDIIFREYGIKKKVYPKAEYPVFYTRNGVIKGVIIPFSKEKDIVWYQYDVK